MQGPTYGVTPRTIENVSLAYFADYRGVSDSIRDLCTAGFEARDINISQSAAEQKAHLSVAMDGLLPNAIGVHSRLWVWRKYREHDRQRSGADQMSGLNPAPSEGTNPTCSSLNLRVALSAMQVPSIVITLLLQDAQSNGMFMLVDADNRVREADWILDKNAGCLRTQYLR